MKKKISVLLILALLLALLCGCGASKAAYDTEYAVAYDSAASTVGWAPMEAKAEEEAYYEDAYQMSAAQGGDQAASSGLPANVKLIYTANMDMESTAFDAAVATIESMVNDCGGYFENSDLGNYGSYRNASYTIRVPAAKFDWFCGTVSDLSDAGEVLQLRNISRSAEDVSEAYYDIESRLATQKTKLERLQELLKKADKMEDIISLESAISDTELTIEQLTGSLRKYDSLVGYSTIHVYLNEVYKLSDVEQPVIGFGAKLAAAFRTGCTRFVDNMEDLALAFARGWVGWLIFIAIAAVVILLIRRSVRRRREQGDRSGRQNRRARRKEAPAIPGQQPNPDVNCDRKD